MKNFSNKNTYRDSDGNRYTSQQIENKVRAAKEIKVNDQFDEHGYNFCEDCKRNTSCGEPIDCSHDISVLKAKVEGFVELAWDVENITMRCRTCHRKHDRTL